MQKSRFIGLWMHARIETAAQSDTLQSLIRRVTVYNPRLYQNGACRAATSQLYELLLEEDVISQELRRQAGQVRSLTTIA